MMTETQARITYPDVLDVYMMHVSLRCEPEAFERQASLLEREVGAERQTRYNPSTGKVQREVVRWTADDVMYSLEAWQGYERVRRSDQQPAAMA